jgi:hypothetical protein
LIRERAAAKAELLELISRVAHDYMHAAAGRLGDQQRAERLRIRLESLIAGSRLDLKELDEALVAIDGGANPDMAIRPVLGQLYGEIAQAQADASNIRDVAS